MEDGTDNGFDEGRSVKSSNTWSPFLTLLAMRISLEA